MTELTRAEEKLRSTLESMPPTSRALLLEVLTLPEVERGHAIGGLHQDGRFASLAELLIDLEEDSAARALVAGKMREG